MLKALVLGPEIGQICLETATTTYVTWLESSFYLCHQSVCDRAKACKNK